MSNNRVSETKGLIRGGANVALSCALAASLTPTVALADEVSSSSGSDTVVAASQADAAIDITAQWNAGGMAITQGGRYVLSGDVHSTGGLVVAVPKGQTATIDLKGHTAEVKGDAQAAVIVDDAGGSVAICDSSFDESVTVGDRKADDEASACIRLISCSSSSSVAAVRWNASEDSKSDDRALSISHVKIQAALLGAADTVSADDKLDCYAVYAGFSYDEDDLRLPLTFDGVSLSAVVADETVARGDAYAWAGASGSSVKSEHAGIAADLYTQAKGVKVNGALRADAASTAGAVQIYTTQSDSIELMDNFSTEGSLGIYEDGAQAGGVALTCANEELAGKAAGWLTDAVGKFSCEASGNKVVFVQRNTAANSVTAINEPASLSGESASSETSEKSAAQATSSERDANPLLNITVEGSPLKMPSVLSSLAESSTDLNKAWSDKQSGFVIRESGTYFLSEDLHITTSGYLLITGQVDVTLQLNGHKLIFETEPVVGYCVGCQEGANLSIVGGTSQAGEKGAIYGNGSSIYDGVRMTSAGNLEMNNVAVTLRPSIEHSSVRSLNARAVNASAGNVSLRSCDLVVDQSNITTTQLELPAVHPAGIYSANDAKAIISVKDSMIDVTASPVTISANSSDLADAEFTGAGYSAYGLYTASRYATTVENCKVRVRAAQGMAIGMLARNASIEGEGMSITASSPYVCAGVQSTKEAGVALNAPVSLSLASNANPCRKATLYGSATSAFSIGAGFAGTEASALVRIDDAENTAGMIVGTFSFSPSTAQISAFGANISNGLGSGASCDIEARGDGIRFVLAEKRAAASVVHADGSLTAYSSANEALAAAANGETVALARDADAVSVSGKQSGQSVTLDLAGHSVESLANSSACDLTVTSSAGRGKITGGDTIDLSGARCEVSVYHTGEGALNLSNIDVAASGKQYAMYGLLVTKPASAESTGNVTCQNVSVTLTPSANTATAVAVQGGTGSPTVSFEGGSISVLQSSVTSSAYAIDNRNASASVQLLDCPVSVEAVSGSAVAVSTSGSFSARSDTAAGQTISVQTTGSANSANGIFATAATVSLENVALSVQGATRDSSADVYCLRDVSSAANSSTWKLDGTCSFASSADKVLYECGATLEVGASFGLVGASALSIYAANATTDVFGTIDAANEASDDVVASWFAPVAGSAYDGWVASAAAKEGQVKTLSWTREALVTNASTGTSYASLSRALSEANSGETLKLVEDGAVYGAQTVSQADLTIDLAGHNLSVYGTSSSAAGVLLYDGAGSLSLIDSAADAAKGQLSLYAGSAQERSTRSAEQGSAYSGIYASAGSVSLQDANVRVVYNGGGANANAETVEVVGCYLASGNASLNGSAYLQVEGAAEEGGACASQAYSLYAAKNCTGSIDVSDTASVSATNTGGLIQSGNVLNGNVTSSFEQGYQVFRRIEPDTSSSLYQEILQKFRAQAKLDDGSGDTDYGFGQRVYYVSAMVLDDGTLVWAVSDQVADGQETLESITPKAIFVQAYYSIAPKAVGVSAAEGSGASFTISGAVSATSSMGDAYAVSAAGSGSWVVDGANVCAAGGRTSYEGPEASRVNLADYVKVDKVPDQTANAWFYPSRCDAHELVSCDPCAVGISAQDATNVTIAGSLSVSTSAAKTQDIRANLVNVESSFAPSSDRAFTVGSASGENTSGATFASPTAGATLDPAWFEDAYAKLSPISASDGSLRWDGPYTVTFHFENGASAEHADLVAGASVALPDPALMQKQSTAYTSYEFLGWSKDASSTVAEIDANDSTVMVSGNADYYPIYRVSAKSVTVTFSNLRDGAGTLLPTQQATVGYGETFTQAASGAVMPVQSDYRVGDVAYRFVGWRDSSGTVWDPATFSSEVSFDYATIKDSVNGTVSLSAMFVRVEPGQHLVTFRVDSAVKSYAAADGSSPTYYEATNCQAVAPSKIATQSGYLYNFAGWHSGHLEGHSVGAESVDYDSLSSLPAVSADVVYTACFASAKQQAYVKFRCLQQVDGAWVNTTTGLVSMEYGSDPITQAKAYAKVGDTLVVDGVTYTFLGWSTRQDDKEPLYTDSLPLATCTDSTSNVPTYYAIYRQQAQTLTVNFYDGSSLYATAAGQLGSSTVSEALQSCGSTAPAGKDGKSFLGWSTSSEASSAVAAGSALLSSLAAANGTLNLYAVYGDAFRPTLTFVSQAGSVLGSVEVDAGTSLVSNGEIPSAPSVGGCFFKGWSQPDGKLFDLSAGTSSNMRLTATYGAIGTNANEGDPDSTVTGYVDVSRASLVSDEALGANQVVFALNNQTTVDATLSAQAKVNGDKVVSDAVYSGLYLIDNKKLSVSSDSGSVVVTVGVGSANTSSKVRVYWMDGTGTVRYSSAMDASSGSVRFVLSNYAALSGKGNIAVAEVGADEGALNGATGGTLAKTSSSLQNANLTGGTLSKSAASGSSLANAASAAAAGTAALAEGAAADGGASGASGYDGPDLLHDQTDASIAISDIAGNPVTWALVLLMMGAVGSIAWYALIGRRRGAAQAEEGELDDEAGWSDEAEEPKAPSARTNAGSAPAADSTDRSGGIKF